MKTHTSNFKNNIKQLGRELDSKITYTISGTTTELGNEQLNSVSPHYEGGILKSVMKQLDIDSNVEIPVGTLVNYQLGVKVGNSYEYISFGNYIVKDVEKQEDTRSYKITCYDKMLYSMVDYESMNITYPITIRNYISAVCTKLGLTFKNASSTFTNYNKTISKELYLDSNGKSLGYTFRDVLDELAQVTASTICINEVDDQLEIRYINNTNDTIDEEFLKDVNVNFGEKFGAVNTIVLSRSAGADNIYYPTTLPENPIEIKIADNQIMNGNDRDTFISGIYNRLNGLEYYINDFSSTGICYYNLCDRYNVSIDGTTYSCVMFNDEVNVTQGLEEIVYTDMPEEAVTDYKKADTTDRRINQTILTVDKQQNEIIALVDTTEDIQKEINPTGDVSGTVIHVEDSTDAELTYFEIEGKTEQKNEPTPDNPSELFSVGYQNLFTGLIKGVSINGTTGVETTDVNSATSDYIPVDFNSNQYYYLSGLTNAINSYIFAYNSSKQGLGRTNASARKEIILSSSSFTNGTPQGTGDIAYLRIKQLTSGTPSIDVVDNLTIQLERGSELHPYIPYGKYGIEVKSLKKNMFNINGNVNYRGNNGTITTKNTVSNGVLTTNCNNTLEHGVGQRFTGMLGKTITFSATVVSFGTGGGGTISIYQDGTSSAVRCTTLNERISVTKECTSDTVYCAFNTYNGTGAQFSNIQVEIGELSSYYAYSANTKIYSLNEPLRSIGNVKDLLYIKDGMLYVKRKIGSKIFDGSETWAFTSNGNAWYISNWAGNNNARTPDSNDNLSNSLSNYFPNVARNQIANVNTGFGIAISGALNMKHPQYTSSSTPISSWLISHNTEVHYILATSFTEELGQVDYPITYNPRTNLITTDAIAPNMNITYVKDTQISNYVEQHISEIKVTEDSITSRVESIENNGLEERVNAVEVKQTDTDETINIISTNIDRTNGEVREVTTTTGFTFNAEGMTIEDSNSQFKAQHRVDGTYYKDGTTTVGQYTKDGSKQKDLHLFGVYYYGMSSIDATPMFVAQLYNDGNEEAVGHFYNKGD